MKKSKINWDYSGATSNDYHQKLHERSGSYASSSPLVSFLYILMRDYLTSGDVEEILLKHVEETRGKAATFSNGWVAKHAEDVAERLR